MGIKGLTQTIKKNSPDSISHENLHRLSGEIVDVSASLFTYQNLLNFGDRPLFKNSKSSITDHLAS